MLSKLKVLFYERLFLPWKYYDKIKESEFFQEMLLLFANGMILECENEPMMSNSHLPVVSFVIPHYNASKFCCWCIESVIKNVPHDVNYEIVIADAGSDLEEFTKLKAFVCKQENLMIRFYSAKVRRPHQFLLEFLFRKSIGKFVIILDQDSIILNTNWVSLLREFEKRNRLILVGIRDHCDHRWCYDMVHPSFILLHKIRLKRRVKELIYFSGRKPMIETFRLGPNSMEPYYSLVCKIKKYVGMEAVDYLGTYKTSYLYGTVGYWKELRNPIVFHKWYSGRIKNYSDDDLVDGRPVAPVKADLVKFENDLLNGKLDLEPVEVFC